MGIGTDLIDEWARAQARVIELVAPLTAEQAAVRVPACPEWTVRDLLSHMVGLGTDVLAGDEPDDHNAVWTQMQVATRRNRDVAALVAEWEGLSADLQEWMREHGTRPLGDVIIHEQDLRGALGVPGGKDSGGVRAIRDRFLPRFAARVEELPPIALVAEGWTWASLGAPDDAAVVVSASEFDIARALVTRRSERQLRSWTTRGDVGPYLDGFALLGALPSADLAE
ncbi:MAG: maleylpyruvate isomerase family mycothiol-dependent enzyme [Pseudonocardia sp.]|nr:maleylpyruvate isomerase family mycothiol-dependent enzyme [Pseudonocardia sp.]